MRSPKPRSEAVPVYDLETNMTDHRFGGIESLESRTFLSVATIVGGALVVLGDASQDDTITVSRDGDNVIVDHDDAAQQSFNVNLFNVISIRGNTGNDTLTVDGSIDVPTQILGQGGNDVIDGGPDRMLLNGGSGNDEIRGDGVLIGGSGDDTILGGRKRDFLYGGSGDDSIRGGKGSDIIFAGKGNDTCKGDDGNDIIFGDTGNDNTYGGDGNDKLFGILGKDTLFGEEGDDTLYGGAGADVMDGGPGVNKVKSGEYDKLQDLIDQYEELADSYIDA
jgi:Ca2+-binding RTX toxin-like protein